MTRNEGKKSNLTFTLKFTLKRHLGKHWGNTN